MSNPNTKIAFLFVFISTIFVSFIVYLWYTTETVTHYETITKVDTVYVKPVYYLKYNGVQVTRENWEDVDLDICPNARLSEKNTLIITPTINSTDIELVEKWEKVK